MSSEAPNSAPAEPARENAFASGKTVTESAVVILHAPMPEESNPDGFMHGGHLLKHIDTAGSIAAARHSRRRVVTAGLERMDFLTPIPLRGVIILKASVQLVGRSSMEVGVRVEVEDLLNGQRRHAASCYLTYVALDENGKPKQVPPLIISSPEEERRYQKASERRRYRETLRTQTAAGKKPA